MPKKKEVRPLFWVTGNYYDCKQLWSDLCSKVGDPNIEILNCGYATSGSNRDATAADVIMLLKNHDMFDNRTRIIKMKGLPENYHLIIDYLGLVNDSNILFIDGPIGLRSKPPSDRFISAATSKFYKTFEGEGKVIKFPTDGKTEREASEWVHNVLKDHKRDIEDDALSMLVQYKGYNYDILYTEIVKLLDYQTSKKIKVEDIKACSIPSFLSTIWELIDSLDAQDYDESIKYMQQFHENAGTEVGSSYHDHVLQFLGALYQHYLFVLILKDKCGSTISYQSAKNAMKFKKREKKDNKYIWEKDLFTEQFINMNLSKKGVQQAFKWNKKKIYDIFRSMGECRLLCRTKGNETLTKFYLDCLIMHICECVPGLYRDLVLGHQKGLTYGRI